jgi:hypothetical protein
LIDLRRDHLSRQPVENPEIFRQSELSRDLDSQPTTWIKTDGTWIAPHSKYYLITVTGAGGSGASGYTGGGGGAGLTGVIRKFINAGDEWTAVFGASAVTFGDGTTSLSAGNGGSGSGLLRGAGASSSAGFDEVFPGVVAETVCLRRDGPYLHPTDSQYWNYYSVPVAVVPQYGAVRWRGI